MRDFASELWSRPVEKRILIVRLLESVDKRARQHALFHGDLSILVEEAIQGADFDKLEVRQMSGRPAKGAQRIRLMPQTSLSVTVETAERIEAVAAKLEKSKNAVVNTAIEWWLDNCSHTFIRLGERHKDKKN